MSTYRLGPIAATMLAISFGVLLQACAATAQPSPTATEPDPDLSIGEPAPAFTLPSATGEAVALADLAGQYFLLYFSMTDG